MSALKYWVWLSSHQGLTSVEKIKLLRAFSAPENIYKADRDEILSKCKIRNYALGLLSDKSMERCEQIIEKCAQLKVQIMTLQDSQYPSRLAEIYDPPVVLYVRGTLPMIDEVPVIAMVGTRKCTAYALTCAEAMGNEVANGGGVIISGLANGVDQAALRGALKSGKPTIGVLGCGHDVMYPKSAVNMRRDIEVKGAVISEYPPGVAALPHNFPTRNRIISGMSVGVAVIEAPIKSGALITARTATEQNRDVFAHPGTVEDAINAGNYALLRDGAKPVKSGADILKEYTHLFPDRIDLDKITPKKKSFFKKNEQEIPDKILMALSDDEAVHVDLIIAKTGLSASDVLSNLTVMEITGAVCQLPGKRFKREPGW